jgi:ER membrane protein complex subunit 7
MTVAILSFLKSPMILMALFSMALIFGMPYLLDNMDPESRAEFEEMQKQSPLSSATNPAAQLQNFDFASWMAGRSQTPEPAAQRQVESSNAGGGKQGGQGGRRKG